MSPSVKPTDQSNLLGSPVNMLDLSGLNPISLQKHLNSKSETDEERLTTGSKTDKTLQHEIDMLRVKVQEQLTSHENESEEQSTQQITSGGFPPCPDTVRLLGANNAEYLKSNRALQQFFNGDGQLTLRNDKIFKADESNLFSTTQSPRGIHLFSVEESKTNQGSIETSQNQTREVQARSVDSIFTKEP